MSITVLLYYVTFLFHSLLYHTVYYITSFCLTTSSCTSVSYLIFSYVARLFHRLLGQAEDQSPGAWRREDMVEASGLQPFRAYPKP